MRPLRNVNEALAEATVMLKVIAYGGSYDGADYHARLLKRKAS